MVSNLVLNYNKLSRTLKFKHRYIPLVVQTTESDSFEPQTSSALLAFTVMV